MDQRSGLQGLAGLLLDQPLSRQFAQLVIDQRQQSLGGTRVALFNGGQDLRYVVQGVSPLTLAIIGGNLLERPSYCLAAPTMSMAQNCLCENKKNQIRTQKR